MGMSDEIGIHGEDSFHRAKDQIDWGALVEVFQGGVAVHLIGLGRAEAADYLREVADALKPIVQDDRLARYRTALQTIADEDYRGNRPASITIAKRALGHLS